MKEFNTYFKDVISLVDNVEGDFVEFGFGYGKSARIITDLMKSNSITKRKCWFYDSFKGLPDHHDKDHVVKLLKNGKEKIINDRKGMFKPKPKTYQLIDRLKNDPSLDIEFVEGWYQDTAEHHEGKVAVLHLDGDLYESYLYSLTHIYPLVVKGGVIIFDDYDKPKWPGCIKAVNEFFGDRTKDILTYKVPSGLGSDKDKTNLHYIRHYLIKK